MTRTSETFAIDIEDYVRNDMDLNQLEEYFDLEGKNEFDDLGFDEMIDSTLDSTDDLSDERLMELVHNMSLLAKVPQVSDELHESTEDRADNINEEFWDELMNNNLDENINKSLDRLYQGVADKIDNTELENKGDVIEFVSSMIQIEENGLNLFRKEGLDGYDEDNISSIQVSKLEDFLDEYEDEYDSEFKEIIEDMVSDIKDNQNERDIEMIIENKNLSEELENIYRDILEDNYDIDYQDDSVEVTLDSSFFLKVWESDLTLEMELDDDTERQEVIEQLKNLHTSYNKLAKFEDEGIQAEDYIEYINEQIEDVDSMDELKEFIEDIDNTITKVENIQSAVRNINNNFGVLGIWQEPSRATINPPNNSWVAKIEVEYRLSDGVDGWSLDWSLDGQGEYYMGARYTRSFDFSFNRDTYEDWSVTSFSIDTTWDSPIEDSQGLYYQTIEQSLVSWLTDNIHRNLGALDDMDWLENRDEIIGYISSVDSYENLVYSGSEVESILQNFQDSESFEYHIANLVNQISPGYIDTSNDLSQELESKLLAKDYFHVAINMLDLFEDGFDLKDYMSGDFELWESQNMNEVNYSDLSEEEIEELDPIRMTWDGGHAIFANTFLGRSELLRENPQELMVLLAAISWVDETEIQIPGDNPEDISFELKTTYQDILEIEDEDFDMEGVDDLEQIDISFLSENEEGLLKLDLDKIGEDEQVDVKIGSILEAYNDNTDNDILIWWEDVENLDINIKINEREDETNQILVEIGGGNKDIVTDGQIDSGYEFSDEKPQPLNTTETTETEIESEEVEFDIESYNIDENIQNNFNLIRRNRQDLNIYKDKFSKYDELIKENTEGNYEDALGIIKEQLDWDFGDYIKDVLNGNYHDGSGILEAIQKDFIDNEDLSDREKVDFFISTMYGDANLAGLTYDQNMDYVTIGDGENEFGTLHI